MVYGNCAASLLDPAADKSIACRRERQANARVTPSRLRLREDFH
ncbi:hypothetical protein SAMN04489711_1304 [Paracidovorax wautersii]|uniref:Uncharacterized protein n=1 Tax=Paracidovorax wautersii TaxID=1177982 RepID=A0A1I2HPR2_9BURK|nr:hypothetical protein SAMN04489711_1304 [Paracidovorax wautersii]